MHKYSIDILTVIPINEIRVKGILFVKDNLKDAIYEGDDKQKMITFWNYFENFWMSSETYIKAWNIYDYQGNKNLLKRTNNGLESYNKRLKSLFRSGTPCFADFVNMLRGESAYQQKKVQDYMDHSAVKRKKIEVNDGNFIYEIPPCYANWVPPSSIDN